MSFRLGDTMVYVDPSLTAFQRTLVVPGKFCTTDNIVLCNPAVAADQRAAGKNPGSDTTFFYNLSTNCNYLLCDIFDYDSSWAASVASNKNFCIGDLDNWSFAKTQAEYGTFICPVAVIPQDPLNNGLTFNNTSIHYCLTLGVVKITNDYIETGYELEMDLGSSTLNSIQTAFNQVTIFVRRGPADPHARGGAGTSRVTTSNQGLTII